MLQGLLQKGENICSGGRVARDCCFLIRILLYTETCMLNRLPGLKKGKPLCFFAIHFPDMVAGICKQTGSEVHSGLRHDIYYWQSLFFASWQCDSSSLHSQKIY